MEFLSNRYLTVGCAFLALLVTAPKSHGVEVKEIRINAVAGDGKNDTPAFLEAFKSASENPGCRVVLGAGVYDLHAVLDETGKPAPYILNYRGLKDVTIDGQGAELRVHGFYGVFHFDDCKNLLITNLKIDYARLPFSQGLVTNVKDNYFDVQVEKEYPVVGAEAVGAFMDFEPDTRLPVRHGLDEYWSVEKTELIAPQLLRIHLKHPARIKEGKLALLRHAVYNHNAFMVLNTDGLTLRDIEVYSAPGMGLVTERCRDILLERFNVRFRPGTKRLMSATADATHYHGTRGFLTIKDCIFEGMGDDAGNIKAGHYLTVKTVVDEHTVEAAHSLKLPDVWKPGDKIEFNHHSDMLAYTILTVKNAEWLNRDGLHRITFEEKLPVEMIVGDLLGNASATAKVRVSGCTVRNNRARGFLLQGRDMIVEDCKFYNCTSGGVWVVTEVFFFNEAINSRNVIVRNNYFENCNYGGPLDRCVIGAWAIMSQNELTSKPGVHQNITIEGNTVIQSDHAGILINGVDGAVVRGNRLEMTSDKPKWETGTSAIHISASRNVHVENNKIDPRKQGKSFREPVFVDKNNGENVVVKP